MTGLYGSKFTNAYGVEPTPEWGFVVGGLDPDEIRRGLDRLVVDIRFKTFVPTPMEFSSLCLPTAGDFGLPSEDVAYRMALSWGKLTAEDKHPAVLFALRLFDVFGWRRADAVRSRKIFESAWSKTVEHVATGGELPEIPEEIAEGSVVVTEQGQAAGRAAMREAMG